MENSLFAIPRKNVKIEDCFFYHTMELPKSGLVKGFWDLRDSTDAYLGNVNFKGKSVLEVGVANGYLTFYMEKKGARVVGFDLSQDFPPDVVPFAKQDTRSVERNLCEHIRKQGNGYWLAHEELNSKASIAYGSIYSLPNLGQFEICTFGDVLLHLRDPFLALQNALRHTSETVIITEPLWGPGWAWRILNFVLKKFPYLIFLPNPKTLGPNNYSWWILPPQTLKRLLGVLGFNTTSVIYHSQKAEGLGGKMVPHYTMVAHRSKEQ